MKVRQSNAVLLRVCCLAGTYALHVDRCTYAIFGQRRLSLYYIHFLVFLCCLEFVESLEKESKYFDLKGEIETNATLSCDDVLTNEEVKCQSVAASRETNDRSSFVSTQAADAFSKASYVRTSSGKKHQCVAQKINSTVNATCVLTPCKKAHLINVEISLTLLRQILGY